MSQLPPDLEYDFLCKKVLELTGLDLSGYKLQQTQRRLRALMVHFKVPNQVALIRLLEHNPATRQEFRDFFTINVSEFYRDNELFEELRKVWLPRLVSQRKEQTLRIWSAACSIGQEPYTLAMILENDFPNQPYQILATDLDRVALARARKGGPYTEHLFNKLPIELQERYFQKREDGFYVDAKLHNWINFRPHDLQQGPFAGRYDLIVCRNVIIYFTNEVKQALYYNLAQSLRPNGILFLGGSEIISRPQQYGLRLLSGPFYAANDNKGKLG